MRLSPSTQAMGGKQVTGKGSYISLTGKPQVLIIPSIGGSWVEGKANALVPAAGVSGHNLCVREVTRANTT